MTQRDWFGKGFGAGSGHGGDGGGGGDEGGEGAGVPRMPRPASRRRGPLGPTIAIVAVVILLFAFGAQLWTEKLWYDSVGFTQVFRTELVTKIVLFLVAGALTAGVVSSSLLIAYRSRPVYAPVTPEQQNLDHYREMIEPLRRLAFFVVPVVVGLFAGGAATSQWQTVLLWLNRVPFGTKDAHFNMDVGFFVFTLPWLNFLTGFFTMVLVLGLLAAALTHYVYGGLQLQSRTGRTTRAARIHLCILLAAIVLVRAASYWLDRYDLTTKDTKLMTGIAYTDAHAVLPTKAILAVAALVCAGLFVSTIWTRSWRLPLLGLSLLVICAIVIGGIYPALVQNFKVEPSQQKLESMYIKRNIDATRAAYGIDDAEVTPYNAQTEASQGQLRNDADTIPGIRLVDPSLVSPTFQQLQAIKSYYRFADALDVDRYLIDGKPSDTVIAVRELDLSGVPAEQRNWVNDHTVYTHGFGVVAAYGNQRGPDGQPVFFEKNIPPVGPLGTFEPRIYFGEKSPVYSIAGGPEGSNPQELDYPDQTTNGQKSNTYQGTGGVPMGTFLKKVAYATKYRDINIMLSNTVNAQSRLLDHRTPRQRVQRVAPWLNLDGNTYPAVVDGRVKWIVDGYTTSAHYPYSRLESIGTATSDSLTARSQSVTAIESGQVNYIRNSVKATVDAYDGSVHLYAWDDQDPLLRAWSKAFDGSVEPLSAISGQLMSHLRYPEDLFKVQRKLMADYHVTNPDAFYIGQDYWKVPDDPTQEQVKVDQPPYYLSITMPGQDTPSFSLTTTFMPTGENRPVLAGFMAADANAGDVAGKRRAGYGKIRLLELPRDTTVKGPGQVQNDIESSNTASPRFTQTLSQFLSLNRQEGSQVALGNLLTLPVGGGLLYVEPIYVQAKTGSSYPLSRAIVAAFGDKLAWSDTLNGALDGLFGGNSGATAGDSGSSPTPPGTAQPSPTSPTSPASPSAKPSPTAPGKVDQTKLTQALTEAQKAFSDGQAALKRGDFAAYGEAQKELKAAIAKAVAASPSGGAVDLSPTPGSTTTPSPSPSAAP